MYFKDTWHIILSDYAENMHAGWTKAVWKNITLKYHNKICINDYMLHLILYTVHI